VDNYYYIDLESSQLNELNVDLLKFGIEFVYEGELTEAEIDKELGNLSYCGGELDPQSLEDLEALINAKNKKIYFTDLCKAKHFTEYLRHETGRIYSIKNEDVVDWSEQWKKHYKTIDLKFRNMKIVPSWEKLENKKQDIYIYPGQGFGTGTHETSRQCLEILAEIENEKMLKVLDFGCGSGILGIGHQKQFYSEATYYDIDNAAVENTLINLKLNEVSNYTLLKSEQKNKIKETHYDLVFANILKHVILLESDFLMGLKAKYIIFSGILLDQKEEVIDHFSNLKYEIISERIENDWVAILMKRS